MNINVVGDEKQLVTSLENAAENLQQALKLRKNKSPEQRKLCVAAALSASGVLILLLL